MKKLYYRASFLCMITPLIIVCMDQKEAVGEDITIFNFPLDMDFDVDFITNDEKEGGSRSPGNYGFELIDAPVDTPDTPPLSSVHVAPVLRSSPCPSRRSVSPSPIGISGSYSRPTSEDKSKNKQPQGSHALSGPVLFLDKAQPYRLKKSLSSNALLTARTIEHTQEDKQSGISPIVRALDLALQSKPLGTNKRKIMRRSLSSNNILNSDLTILKTSFAPPLPVKLLSNFPPLTYESVDENPALSGSPISSSPKHSPLVKTETIRSSFPRADNSPTSLSKLPSSQSKITVLPLSKQPACAGLWSIIHCCCFGVSASRPKDPRKKDG